MPALLAHPTSFNARPLLPHRHQLLPSLPSTKSPAPPTISTAGFARGPAPCPRETTPHAGQGHLAPAAAPFGKSDVTSSNRKSRRPSWWCGEARAARATRGWAARGWRGDPEVGTSGGYRSFSFQKREKETNRRVVVGRQTRRGNAPAPGSALGSSTDMICTSKMAHSNDQGSWSDLLTELVGLVLGRLPDHTDRIRFAAVCRNWCISAKHPGIPPPLPWLVLSDGAFFTLPRSESFQIPNSAGFHSCSGEWLVFSSEKTCSLVNTFSKATLKLPDLYCFNRIDEPHQVINGHEVPNTVLNTDVGISIWKVVVCSQVLVAAMVRVGGLNTLAFCRPGATLWFVSALGNISLPADIMFYEGKLYTVDTEGDLCSIMVEEDIDSGKLSLSRIERVVTDAPFFFPPWPVSGACRTKNYLVESRGAVLLVRRRTFEQRCGDVLNVALKLVGIDFEVLEANVQSSQWVKVTSLGDDQALFVGKSSRSVCVSQFRQKGNCIFFLEDMERWNFEDAPSSYAMFNMSDGTVDSPLPRGSCKGEKPPATWLFSR